MIKKCWRRLNILVEKEEASFIYVKEYRRCKTCKYYRKGFCVKGPVVKKSPDDGCYFTVKRKVSCAACVFNRGEECRLWGKLLNGCLCFVRKRRGDMNVPVVCRVCGHVFCVVPLNLVRKVVDTISGLKCPICGHVLKEEYELEIERCREV